MSSTFASREMPFIRIGDQSYILQKINDDLTPTETQRSDILRFDDLSLSNMKPYKYKHLKASKKRIRLLQLEAGTIHSPAIYCKLVEADYDNVFHIPTRVVDNDEEESPQESVQTERPRQDAEWLAAEALRVRKIEIKYQALSWCWGSDTPDYTVIIKQGVESYKKRVRKDLALALKYLRKPNKRRCLWIDAICIDQDNPEERNQQVQMMSRIYTRAEKVCIWLGTDSDESKLAFDFIREEITQLRNFDAISSDKKYSDKWRALMMLMQREWFSRRWVVQEISLAKKAEIYCGPYSIPWKEFAVAVELFVEVETATHRLSEVMQKDEKFRHVPGWFEYVSELGASLLVQATGKVFRAHRTPMDDDHDDLREPGKLAEFFKTNQTIDPLDRRSLLSLEYLVTTMFIFKATECRDSIYSMLAIARDAAPFAGTADPNDKVTLVMSLFDCFLAEKPFVVDYTRPYSDVCRDFVEFCIQRKSKLAPIQALDILCRPWALEPQVGKSIRVPKVETNKPEPIVKRQRLRPQHETNWKKRVCQVRFDASVSEWKYDKEDEDKWVDDQRPMSTYWQETEMLVSGEKVDTSWTYDGITWTRPKNWDKVQAFVKGHKTITESGEEFEPDLELPSWVARAENAPFKIYPHPGIHIRKTGRANADPLVGPPQDGHRNYSAAQTKEVKMAKLKFKKRPYLKHYSLYVAGFELDEVGEVTDASQGGNIPKSWLDLSGWKAPYDKDPPSEFWRTIVADRGQDNRNPPYYYARACKESVDKGGIASGMVNTSALINNERNSIIAEFCRRVHAVIWGRSLFRTKKGKLGVAAKGVQPGDKICILYGCTVPVILREAEKSAKDREDEELEDRYEAFRYFVRRLEKICIRKERYRKKTKDDERWKLGVERETKLVNDTLRHFKELRESTKEREKAILEEMKANMNTGDQSEDEDEAGNEQRVPDDRFYHIFNGESYVHGCMDGEAIRTNFYEATQERTFELR